MDKKKRKKVSVFKWWLMIMKRKPLPSWPIKDLQRDIFEGSPSKPRLASTAASGDFCY